MDGDLLVFYGLENLVPFALDSHKLGAVPLSDILVETGRQLRRGRQTRRTASGRWPRSRTFASAACAAGQSALQRLLQLALQFRELPLQLLHLRCCGAGDSRLLGGFFTHRAISFGQAAQLQKRHFKQRLRLRGILHFRLIVIQRVDNSEYMRT
ncbi:hypothetical protein D1872_233890 [compost metagenome]